MCRCLQNLWEDFYWHCIEEKFCFDETIAYYDPDEDDAASAPGKKKNALDAEFIEGDGKNAEIIVNQPLARHCSLLGTKAHEDDFQREIQTTVPILAPEVMAAFAQSQIFHEHNAKPKAALARIETKAKITTADVTGSNHVSDQDAAAEKLLSRLEGIAVGESSNSPVVFKLADDDTGSVKQANTFQSIAEEDVDGDDEIADEVDLRAKAPRREISLSSQTLSPAVQKKRPFHLRLKHVQSVPQLPSYPGLSSAIGGRPLSQVGEPVTKDGVFIIPTPELPAISMKRLPRNYLDTPSIDAYAPVAGSLTSIQMQNKQRGDEKFNFQMPRYYGHSELYLPTPAISQEEINRSNLRAAKQAQVSLKKNRSMINLNLRSSSPDPRSASTLNILQAGQSEGRLGEAEGSTGSVAGELGLGAEKSKRLKILRGNLPPLMIQTKDKAAAEKDRH